MRCGRCTGLMHTEYAMHDGECIRLWACVLCGERMDDTIQVHRIFAHAETEAARQWRVRYSAEHQWANPEC